MIGRLSNHARHSEPGESVVVGIRAPRGRRR